MEQSGIESNSSWNIFSMKEGAVFIGTSNYFFYFNASDNSTPIGYENELLACCL